MAVTPPMIVLAVSDKGGTGRSVTACNIAFQLASMGKNVAYLDFDFGSPTAGAIFEISQVSRGIEQGGLHSYFIKGSQPQQLDVRASSNRQALQTLHSNVGRLVLLPGDQGGAEFTSTRPEHVRLTERLFQEIVGEFHVCIVDLSAGRSLASQFVLAATALPSFRNIDIRWLVFHRWTRQHLTAAHSLVFQPYGLLAAGEGLGHDPARLRDSIRFVRTAVPDLSHADSAERAEQAQWLHTCNDALRSLARKLGLGKGSTLGNTPMEPMLQWQEQIVLDSDVSDGIANSATIEAFRKLARRLIDPAVWERL